MPRLLPSAVVALALFLALVPGAAEARRIDGTASADVLRGTRAADVIRARGGGDRVYGRGGNDRLYGQGGSDRLVGNAGNDRLYGGVGGDYLVGGFGVDRLYGGGGRDRIQARDGRADLVNCGPGPDRALVDLLDRVHRSCQLVLRKPVATQVTFVDVGQGDGAAMRIGNTIVVSDAGENFAADEMHRALTRLKAKKTINVAILSHPHDDHVGGFERLVSEFGYTIKRALLPANDHWQATATNRSLMKLLAEKKVKLRYVKAGDRFRFGGSLFRIIGPPKGTFTADDDAANASIVYLLQSYGRKFLFTGDIEEQATNELIKRWRYGRVDVFLATHHGSKHGSPTSLLAKIRPRHAVISVGNNGFGHPTPEVIQRLEEQKTTIWCTSANGDITAIVAASKRLAWRATKLKRAWSIPGKARKGACGEFAGASGGGGTGGGGGGANCHPAYEPCLPVVDDLDCGEIPASKKPVTVKVIGQDPYRLDADKDGVACEP